LSISINVDEIPNLEIRRLVETVIRRYIGDRPVEEHWSASVHVRSTYCLVTVTGPRPTRQQHFFDDMRTLPEKIGSWLNSYPLT
jgi:hypothetical protein